MRLFILYEMLFVIAYHPNHSCGRREKAHGSHFPDVETEVQGDDMPWSKSHI